MRHKLACNLPDFKLQKAGRRGGERLPVSHQSNTAPHEEHRERETETESERETDGRRTTALPQLGPGALMCYFTTLIVQIAPSLLFQKTCLEMLHWV